MGLGRWLIVVGLTGCRLNFADVDGGNGGGGDGGTGGDGVVDDGGVQPFTCARTVPTTPTIWCDTNAGADGNPGTQSSKVKTITRALQLVGANGGTIIVGPGNYGETLDISSTKPFLLFSEERYAARIARVGCSSCTDLTVEGFEITGASLSLVQINAGSRVVIRDNAIYGGNSAGVRITSGSTAITIESNLVWDTVSAPIHLNDASATIRNNVVFNNNGSTSIGKIWLEAANNTVVAGNVIFRGSGNDGGYGMISLRDTTGTTIVENNLVAGSPSATNVYASIGFDMATGSAMIRHNLYWNAPSGPFSAGGSPTPASDAEATIGDPGMSFTLPAAPVRQGTGFVGGAMTTCEVHDQLVDAMAKIAAASPATGAADPTQSPTVDIRGRARPSPAALGAYEP